MSFRDTLARMSEAKASFATHFEVLLDDKEPYVDGKENNDTEGVFTF